MVRSGDGETTPSGSSEMGSITGITITTIIIVTVHLQLVPPFTTTGISINPTTTTTKNTCLLSPCPRWRGACTVVQIIAKSLTINLTRCLGK